MTHLLIWNPQSIPATVSRQTLTHPARPLAHTAPEPRRRKRGTRESAGALSMPSAEQTMESAPRPKQSPIKVVDELQHDCSRAVPP